MENKQEKSLPESRTYTVEEIAAILDMAARLHISLLRKQTFGLSALAIRFGFPRNRLKHGGIVSSDNRAKAPRKNVALCFMQQKIIISPKSFLKMDVFPVV